MDIRLLPGVVLTAVGQHLPEPDAASCRLASAQLAAVAGQQQQGSHLQVVAASFQAQLRAELRKDTAPAAAAAAAAAAGPTVQCSG
ncbi:hypothetical protein OEZ85_005685 [Tetradesmus obliquus]|uniref:Uncharacterized protein n=1 Tax=Tetradesmus obliquus TaxID=3088 RepID=A0ABY8UHX7_TETOB|nr:hypothetical protein OEZ85_005685 [Tetradesmus obliquus]